MSILLLLLTSLLLSACQGRSATLLPPTENFLQENIFLLRQLLHQQLKVSCEEMNVTDVFAGDKTGDDAEILCKAAAVLQESQSCHSYLEGIYFNLLVFMERKSMGHKAPCPLARVSTTSLKEFLSHLEGVHQRLMKNKGWK